MSTFLIWLSSFVLVFAAASTGARFRPSDWYFDLRKPPATPPPWVFPVVWTALYLGMAIAAAQVALTPSPLRAPALLLFVLQLGANAAWSWLFFGRRQIVWAWADLLLLLVLVSATLLLFAQIQDLAAFLMLPYLLWLLVALYLNSGLWWLNRRSLGR